MEYSLVYIHVMLEFKILHKICCQEKERLKEEKKSAKKLDREKKLVSFYEWS